MHLQSFKLQRLTVWEYVYFTFDLGLGFKVIRNVAHYHLHYKNYAPAKFEVATTNSLQENALFDL